MLLAVASTAFDIYTTSPTTVPSSPSLPRRAQLTSKPTLHLAQIYIDAVDRTCGRGPCAVEAPIDQQLLQRADRHASPTCTRARRLHLPRLPGHHTRLPRGRCVIRGANSSSRASLFLEGNSGCLLRGAESSSARMMARCAFDSRRAFDSRCTFGSRGGSCCRGALPPPPLGQPEQRARLREAVRGRGRARTRRRRRAHRRSRG